MSELEAIEAQEYRKLIQTYPTITFDEAIAGEVHPHALQENDLVRDPDTGIVYRAIKSSPRTSAANPQPERDSRTS